MGEFWFFSDFSLANFVFLGNIFKNNQEKISIHKRTTSSEIVKSELLIQFDSFKMLQMFRTQASGNRFDKTSNNFPISVKWVCWGEPDQFI